jgi:hypothetical protein
MAERHVVFALRAKYARLKGALEHYRGDDPEPLETAKHQVGAVLLMFNPSEDLEAVRAVRPCSHRRGRWSRLAMDMLRHANGPLTAQELTRRIMAEVGLDQTDAAQFSSIECALHRTLGKLEGDAIVRVTSRPKRWALPDDEGF